MYPQSTAAVMKARNQRLYTIGETADILKVSVPTIRMYEYEGLLLPMRKPSRHRLYSDRDLERIRCIRHTINEENVSIAELKHMLAMIPCWNIRKCSAEARSTCGAYIDRNGPCWAASHKAWDCRSSQCRSCTVYVDAADCKNLKQNISRYAASPSP